MLLSSSHRGCQTLRRWLSTTTGHCRPTLLGAPLSVVTPRNATTTRPVQQRLVVPAIGTMITTMSSQFSTAAAVQKQKEKIVDARKQLWEFYLSTGRGANALFEAIDLDEDGVITPAVLQDFMKDVLAPHPPTEIMPYAWNRLEQRAAASQVYDLKAFKAWLIAATKMSADTRNQRMLSYFKEHPLYHELYPDEQEEEPDVYTWNEDSMNQSL